MRSSRPPALATWLLEHLTMEGTKEALVGDLIEEYQHRRSAGWYWHQVLGAILASFVGGLRAEWIIVRTIGFVIVWVYSLHVFFLIVHPFRPGTRSLAWMEAHGGDAMVLTLVTLLVVAVPLGIHLAVQRSLGFRDFALGMSVGTIVMFTLRFLTDRGLLPLLSDLGTHGISKACLYISYKWYLAYIYPALPLLAAMWVTRRVRARRHPTAIPV